MKIGILGAGGIAVQMAKTVAGMKDVENYAVAARSFERAQAFAEKYGFSKAYGSYEEMLADPQVDLVYIATPHSHHYLHAKMCLEAGKNVLCEKAFTVNADQARKLFALAKEKNLLITEAIWTRYMPSRKMIDDIISSGVIGEVTAVTANLNYAISEVERIRKPELAGGALLDVGVYTINFASMVLGDKLKDVQATAIFREGVDMLDTIAMVFEGDRMATCSVVPVKFLTEWEVFLEPKVIFRCRILIIRRKSQCLTRSIRRLQLICLRHRSQAMSMRLRPAPEQSHRAKRNARKCLMMRLCV